MSQVGDKEYQTRQEVKKFFQEALGSQYSILKAPLQAEVTKVGNVGEFPGRLDIERLIKESDIPVVFDGVLERGHEEKGVAAGGPDRRELTPQEGIDVAGHLTKEVVLARHEGLGGKLSLKGIAGKNGILRATLRIEQERPVEIKGTAEHVVS